MNELQIFNNQEFGKIRIVEVESKPYAVGNDVARVLEYSSPKDAISAHCRGAVTYPLPTFNQHGAEVMTEMKVIPIGDIYRLITKAADQSRNPAIKAKAERFERWIFDEVLPQIGETGGYIATNADDTEADIMAKAVLIAQKTINEQKNRILALTEENEKNKPKIVFADAVSASNSTILIGELAKILNQNGINIGQNRLFQQLRNDGFLIRRKGTDYNSPTQRAMDMGLFKLKETVISRSDGSITVSKTTKVTGKGQQYFVNRFWVCKEDA